MSKELSFMMTPWYEKNLFCKLHLEPERNIP